MVAYSKIGSSISLSSRGFDFGPTPPANVQGYIALFYSKGDLKMSTKKLNVGKSEIRTPGKHSALNKYLGKHVGVIDGHPGYKYKTFHVIDCTAGDGIASSESGFTSPSIIQHHYLEMKERGIDIRALLIEKQINTYKKLKENTILPVKNMDARKLTKIWNDKDILFIINDPNHIGNWSLPESLSKAPKLTTVFSTLGCNVGGLKRLPAEERIKWKEQIYNQLNLLQHWHDALLVRLERDHQQWAYLVNASDKWRESLEKCFSSSFKDWKKGLSMTWLKLDPKKFEDEISLLITSRKDNVKGGQLEIFDA